MKAESVPELDEGMETNDGKVEGGMEEGVNAEGGEGSMQDEKQLSESSNLMDTLHGGRPKDEEPHVKKSVKKKREKTEYIVRVDLDELGISEDEFEDLQSLFELFDHDKDGILSLKETMKLLRCLGFRADEQQARCMAGLVSVDEVGFSVSFNEYLRLVSLQRRAEPDENSLMDVFLSLDPEHTGKIDENHFRKMMKSKEAIPEQDIEDMLQEYKRITAGVQEEENVIYYKDFISMLQQ